MKKILGVLLVLIFFCPASDVFAAKRPHVRIHKTPPGAVCNYPGCDRQSRGDVALAAVPVVAVVFDVARRTSCDPRVAIGTGPGDPGFDPAGPKVGNFLIPAIYRSECGGARPKWYGW
jgi:hypothetical protein